MTNETMFDMQLEFQEQIENIRSKPIVLSLGYRYIKSYPDKIEYWIKKKLIIDYVGSSKILINSGTENQPIWKWESPREEKWIDEVVSAEEWKKYDKIEIIKETKNIETETTNGYMSDNRAINKRWDFEFARPNSAFAGVFSLW